MDVRHARTVAQSLGHWLGTSTSSLHIDGNEVDVHHGFHRCDSVKPLARHVHQTRF